MTGSLGVTAKGFQSIADAEPNRERLIEAAREVFAENGIDASMNEVARRAKGRRGHPVSSFPTRDDLITATFADKITACADAADQALADPDPWHGFCGCIERALKRPGHCPARPPPGRSIELSSDCARTPGDPRRTSADR